MRATAAGGSATEPSRVGAVYRCPGGREAQGALSLPRDARNTAACRPHDRAHQDPSGYKTGTVDLWCRCQDGSGQTITGEVTTDGGIAHVTWDTGLKMDFLMVVQDGSLLVDDTQC